MRSIGRPVTTLDVGAGTGKVAEYLSGVVDGIDISKEMLEKAAAKGLYRRRIVADLTKPLDDLPDNSYANIVSAGTFTHGHCGPEVLPELLRVAQAGALFVLGINTGCFDKLGFGSAFAEHVAARRITPVRFRHVPIYDGTGRDTGPNARPADDTNLVAVFYTVAPAQATRENRAPVRTRTAAPTSAPSSNTGETSFRYCPVERRSDPGEPPRWRYRWMEEYGLLSLFLCHPCTQASADHAQELIASSQRTLEDLCSALRSKKLVLWWAKEQTSKVSAIDGLTHVAVGVLRVPPRSASAISGGPAERGRSAPAFGPDGVGALAQMISSFATELGVAGGGD